MVDELRKCREASNLSHHSSQHFPTHIPTPVADAAMQSAQELCVWQQDPECDTMNASTYTALKATLQFATSLT